MAWFASPLHRLIAAALALLLIVGGWFGTASYPFGALGPYVVIHVVAGETVSQLAGDLSKNKVISSTFAYRIHTLIFSAPVLHPGNYAVHQNASFSEVDSSFSGGPLPIVDVQPGLTLREIALNQIFSAKGNRFTVAFLAATRKEAARNVFRPGESLEGLVGTGIYALLPDESAAQLARQMADRFVAQAAAVGIVPGANFHGLTPYQLIVAASIVEKEGYYVKNMGPVARVILNRLARHNSLQMDATILYSFHMDGGRVTSAMLHIDTPYNTYLHSGLTPTPICTPSTFALNAMVKPPAGNWEYFTLISRDGTEAFANTFAEQLANEQLAASRGL